MKKIIIAVLALLSIGVVQAQFKVEQKQSAPEAIWREGFGWVSLYQQNVGNGEDYYFIACRSSNQFDDMMLIHLGSKEKALATLAQLEKDLYVEGEIYELSDDKGESFTLKCGKFNYYYIYKRGYAGYGYIKMTHIPKMQSAINGY